MKVIDIKELSGPTDWSGPTFGGISDAAVKFRWINSAFRWHRNDGPELFLVLDGEVDMHFRAGPDAPVEILTLTAGKGVWMEEGDEHVAHPKGEARILVVEEAQSA